MRLAKVGQSVLGGECSGGPSKQLAGEVKGRALWPLLPVDIRPTVRLFTLGGEAVAARIEAQGFNTLQHRPTLSRTAKTALVGRAMLQKILRTG